MLQIFRSISLLLTVLFIASHSPASAAIKLETWKTYGNLAEQGAVCASFAALMESQSILNPDLGMLWSERRKYSGSIILKASEMETGTAANSADIDVFVSDYREWVLSSLLAPIAPIDLSQQGGDPLKTGRDRITTLVRTYCLAIYAKGDAVILTRFPQLAYLMNKSAMTAQNQPEMPKTSVKTSNNTSGNKTSGDKTSGDKISGKSAETAAAKVISSMLASMRAPEPVLPKSMPKQRPAKPVALTSLSAQVKGGYLAQLASFSSQKRAESSRDLLIQKFPNAFTSKTLHVEEHVIASGTRFFRVQTAATTKDKAREYCDMLWLQKISCLVRQAQ
ncbi:SPOR domain-containing protein [Alphaproteobacteria bacterium]|nr:SPOR domain-containing protein [Alphaproteobacteria bacterium]